MFRLLRYFSVTSAVAIAAVTAVLVFLYRDNLVDEIVAQAEIQNEVLAHSLANSVWSRLPSAGEAVPAEGREIDVAMRKLISGVPVVRVRILEAGGRILYSSDPGQIGTLASDTAALVDARDGRKSSRLIFRNSAENSDSVLAARNLVVSYLPVRSREGAIEGVIELHSDVTGVMERIEEASARLMLGLVLAFGGLYGVLFVIVRHADGILGRQYRELQANQQHIHQRNQELTREVAERRLAEEELNRVRDELELEVAQRTIHMQREMADRQVTEAVLRESGKRFRDFTETAHEWYWETDVEFRFHDVSESFLESSGRRSEDIIGFTVRQLRDRYLTPSERDDAEKWRRHAEDLAHHRPFRDFTMSWTRPDGEVRVFIFSGRPAVDPDGTFVGYRGTGTDITELRFAEEGLRRSEARLRDILNNASAGILIKDTDGRFLFVNRQFERLFGLRNEDIRGRTGDEVLPSILAAAFRINDRKVLDTGQPLELEETVPNEDGEHTYLTVRFPLLDGDGRPYAVCGILTDISERKRMEEALRESEDRYAIAIKGANDAIWDWDLRSGHMYASPRLAAILGFEEKDFLPTLESWLERIHPDNQEKYLSWLRTHLRGESEFFSCEYQVRNRDGEYLWLLDRGVALRDSEGRVYRMAGSIGDVTKRRLAEDRLRQSQKIQALGQLAGGIAHEFNNLLVGIGGFADMALDNLTDAERVKVCLEEVVKASDRAAKLTSELLTFSRKQVANPTLLRISLADIVNDCANLLKTVVGPKVDLKSDISEGDACVMVDPSQISQVITNLAINGRDAMPQGGTLTVGTRVAEITPQLAAKYPAAAPGPYACLYVSDTGTGIEPETMRRLFEPFFTTKDPGKGTGLGLAMVYGIVEQAKGFVDVESTPGEGSTFSVYLPLVDAESEPRVASVEEFRGVIGPKARATILVAEDDDTVRAVICTTLEDHGHKVLQGADGRQALEVWLAHAGPTDLLIADVVMPELGGASVARELLARRPGIKIVFMSAYPDGGRILEEDWGGKACFLQKPFTPNGLAKMVADVLQRPEGEERGKP